MRLSSFRLTGRRGERNISEMLTFLLHICIFSINDIIGLLAWKDSDILDGINKIYTAKFNTDLEQDLLSACEEKYHPVIQICMSENRDDQEDESQIMKSVKVLSRYTLERMRE